MNIWWIFLITVVLSSPIKILTPDEDDFYVPPDNYEDTKVGTILKLRQTPYQIKSIYFPVNIANCWQMLVRSEDTMGNATAVVSTIFEPYNANSSRLVSYQVAEDSASNNCSPSYSFVGGGLSTIVAKLEMFLIQTALDQGYYVVAPDYEGPNSTFTVGKTSGYSTLNTIRAALKTGNVTNIDANADVVMWGYSGGTIASGWAAGMAPDYAKDLQPNLKGVAVGGWVTNITATAEAVDGSLFVGLTANAIAGLSNQYPELSPYIDEQIFANKSKSFNKGYELCLADSILNYAFENVFTGYDRYAKNGWAILDDDIVKDVLLDNTLGINGTHDIKPQIPMFLFHGTKDEIVPYKDAQRVYDIWCDNDGMESLEFATSTSTGHILEVIEGSGAALAWIKKVFEGESLVKGCKKTERLTNLLYPGGITETADVLGAAVSNILGSKIGPHLAKRQQLGEERINGDFELQSILQIIDTYKP